MQGLLRRPHGLFFLFGFLVSMAAKADFWLAPAVQSYYSENNEYKLIVTPNATSDKYLQWDYYRNNRHPQSKRVLRKKKKFMKNISGRDTIVIPCKAALYRMDGEDSVLVWQKPLLNDFCPVHAIVANDGSSVATFDNWHWRGYGVNVFVVYNEKGEAKSTYKLEEITPFPLNDYPLSLSSIYWREEARYINNERIEIVFRTEKDLIASRHYDMKKYKMEE